MSAHRGEDAPSGPPSARASNEELQPSLPEGPPVFSTAPTRPAGDGSDAPGDGERLPPFDKGFPGRADHRPWDQPSTFLAELDRIEEELRGRPPAASRKEGEATAPPEGVDDGEREGPFVSPYLEERLREAHEQISVLGGELRELDARWGALRHAAGRLEEQLGEAAGEAGFLRGLPPGRALSSEPGVPATTFPPERAAPGRTRPTTAGGRRRTDERGAAYVGFTAVRYNRTIGRLKARRLRLAAWTVGLAALISGALVTLARLANEPAPPVWVAVLPLVWLVPVPFFLVSYFATQRVLRRNHLDVARALTVNGNKTYR